MPRRQYQAPYEKEQLRNQVWKINLRKAEAKIQVIESNSSKNPQLHGSEDTVASNEVGGQKPMSMQENARF